MLETTITVECDKCETVFNVTVPVTGYAMWFNNEADILMAMPNVDCIYRILLEEGLCGTCFGEWEAMQDADEFEFDTADIEV